ncbi:pyridoxamine 5'-phosphate oxidase family protein [Streptomyces sp. G5(2025)]|uniref:pyridoxamine 5'-phosphate oxidase family protein n=1 Tax=Streptomyces sp. G5(2025) TaxID=3406628 RepID=UPI003C13B97A
MPIGQREAFLAQLHVGVLGVTDTRTEPAAPILVPVWYAYEPGGQVVVQTGRDTLKARLIGAAGRFSICVQDERPPYRYVSVSGPVVRMTDPVDPAGRAAMAHRYLPPVEAAAYLRATEEQLTDDITFHMRPERWRTADFSTFAAEFA